MASFWPSRFAEMVADERWCEENLDKITSPVFVKSFGGEYTFVCVEKDLKKREDSLVAAFCKKIIDTCIFLNKVSCMCRNWDVTFSN